MSQVKVLKGPGFVYDLLFIFYLQFNTKYCINNYKNLEKNEESKQYFDEIMEKFSDIPEDLFVFFHAENSNSCFMLSCYFDAYKEYFNADYDFKLFQSELTDKNKIICNLIKYYFPCIDENKAKQCVNSTVEMFNWIKDSEYSNEEKRRLYEFFINPEPYIQMLQYELMSKELLLSQYYEKNYIKFLDVQNETTEELLVELVKGSQGGSTKSDRGNIFKKQIYASFCLLDKYHISKFDVGKDEMYLLGCDYVFALDYTQSQNNEIDLQGLGSCLCEESRVRILELLLERDEVICKDLEKIFNFSGSTAYHHLTVLTKTGLVKTRNKGKSVLYSLNRNYFDSIIHTLDKYSNGLKH